MRQGGREEEEEEEEEQEQKEQAQQGRFKKTRPEKKSQVLTVKNSQSCFTIYAPVGQKVGRA